MLMYRNRSSASRDNTVVANVDLRHFVALDSTLADQLLYTLSGGCLTKSLSVRSACATPSLYAKYTVTGSGHFPVRYFMTFTLSVHAVCRYVFRRAGLPAKQTYLR